MASDEATKREGLETITLGGGCFWCTEAVFDELQGVVDVRSGYSGGTVPNPTYREVCTGETGHAEVIQVAFDPAQISLADILRVFFTVHDPTTLNRQGADIGTQYRSVIFTRSPEQEATAREVIAEVDREKIWDGKIVTQVVPFEAFYPAEEYHQEYYANNPNQPYCRLVIDPKVQKFREKFRNRLKKAD
ncbi:MAG: peptide-methionine (S)-S-oxide reductase MsrA [Candidatus Eisenbacteria bacterium]|nr:peptide-methionine (S)-S-oxide reductase MsrA [Candidatus Eisenbacteria bacterium]